MPSTDNKQSAKKFLELIIAGKIEDAYQIFIDMGGKHHNVFTPAGFEALKAGMKEAHTKYPNKQFTIQHIIGDEDLVAVHSHLVLEEKTLDLITMHLFRFNNGKIVEMWDFSQAILAEVPNKDGVF